LQERSRDGSSFAADDWDDRPRTIEEIQAMLQTRKDAALKRERALSYAFSHQVTLIYLCFFKKKISFEFCKAGFFFFVIFLIE
jgi:hypothetical protein